MMSLLVAALAWTLTSFVPQAAAGTPPSGPLQMRDFTLRFGTDGAFQMAGPGWPAFRGTWKADGGEVEILTPDAAGGCNQPARYRIRSTETRTTFEAVSDTCEVRRMILDGSAWHPAGVT